ncbi:GNAT family N-acetyltransferase [Terriglobus sp.]|uniref:GNAT family N-acetyltransferase n=1 Tax=Terriglobus sp. TaxID=1889013 RepID=UPI003B0009E4
MTQQSLILRDFRPGDETAFRHLNEAWITRLFKLEAADLAVFDDPKTYILDKGGRLFFAELVGEAVGCCGLLPIGPGEYEVVKMAVSERAQGKGIGRAILQHTIDQAFAMGATRLYLESNRVLTPALHLYEALGFQHLPAERVTPSPYTRANVFMELYPPA